MVEVGGRPILWHIMKLYAHYGFRSFVLCLGYRGDVIKEYFLNYAVAERRLHRRHLSESPSIAFHDAHAERPVR